MSADRVPPELDGALLCYCTNVTIGELRQACRNGLWPLPGKEDTGWLCQGCAADLLVCLRWFGAEPTTPR